MKPVNKIIALSAVTAGLLLPVAASANGTKPQPFPDAANGNCTREYDPVPYVTKDGRTITAPNPCVAAYWKSQGK